MTVSLVAVDYSRPIQPIFEQEPSVSTIHSVFRKAVNITLDSTILALLSDELPRMPNSVRLRSVVTDELLPKLQPGMEVCVGNDTLVIPTCNFSFHLSDTPVWEPRPDVTTHQWNREAITQHTRLLTQFLAEKQYQGGLAPLVGSLFLQQPIQETPLSRMSMHNLQLLAQASWSRTLQVSKKRRVDWLV